MILLFTLLFSASSLLQPPPVYRVKYQLTYKPDSTNLNRLASETFFLFIKPNEWSYYASENSLKRDSVNVLVKNGTLSDMDLVNDNRNRFRTRFAQFVRKDYLQKSSKVYETIGLQSFIFNLPNDLQWHLTSEQDSIVGHFCTKATTTYAGRAYEAWFTPDIPITDGPYVFSGLPGLIVKLRDSRSHYVFTLEQFGPYVGKLVESPTYLKRQPVAISLKDAFSMRENMRKDPLGEMSRSTGITFDNATFQRHGSSTVEPMKNALPDRSWDNNPLELK